MGGKDKEDKEEKNVDLEFNLEFNSEDATKVDSNSSEKAEIPTMVELALKANTEDPTQINVPEGEDGATALNQEEGMQLELTGQEDMKNSDSETQAEGKEKNKKDKTEISFDNLQVDNAKEDGKEDATEASTKGDSEADSGQGEGRLAFDSLDDMKEETAEIELPSELTGARESKPAEASETEAQASQNNSDESIKFQSAESVDKPEEVPDGIEFNAQEEVKQENKETVAKENKEEIKENQVSPEPVNTSILGDESDMLRLQSTIRQLREEQKHLKEEVKKAKNKEKVLEENNLAIQAELDEIKIENTILKKRHSDQIGELNNKMRVSEDKRFIMEKKMKNYQKEFEKMDQKVRIDFSQVKQKEKELENQLELTSMDSEAQISSRDSKIIELKRKIDMLEFNIENISIKEKKIVER